MSLGHGALIVRSGLVLHLDTANAKSYPGSGSILTDITNNGISATLSNFSVVSEPHTGIRLIDDTGRINLSTVTNITSIELWFYQNVNTGNRYLLDMRSGGAGGWIYQVSAGSNWVGGSMYVNGEFLQTIVSSATTLTNMEALTYQKYAQVVVIASTPATDDITLFSRFSNNESLDVNFYNAKIYNRVLTPHEIRQNFNALRGRYGI